MSQVRCDRRRTSPINCLLSEVTANSTTIRLAVISRRIDSRLRHLESVDRVPLHL